MELKDAIVGRKVIYTPFKECDPSDEEEGIITSSNDTYVFVRYGNDVRSKATNPMDIRYLGDK